jgi:hypothetical protein
VFIPNKSGNLRCCGLREIRFGLSFRRIDDLGVSGREGTKEGEEKGLAKKRKM